ncbi:MAG TPA: sensor histidine kinase [Steroidobacteraceae bacterium]|nr:sensor histidine kinase [Steroidobacteraceae bacterium]
MTDPACLPDSLPGRGAPPPGDPRPLKPRAAPGASLLTATGKWQPINLVWLIYSVFFVIEPVQRNTLRDWLAFAAAYACFLAIYLLLISVRSNSVGSGWKHSALLLALGLLGGAYYPANAGAGGGMLIYVAAMVPFLTESLAGAGAAIAAATLVIAAEGALLHLTPWLWGIWSFLAAGVGIGNLFTAQRIRANKRLGLAQDQIEHLAKVAERERIARDLHDVLGHTLSVVVLKSELAGKLMGSDLERARREIGEVEQIGRQALAEVREAIRGYRADGLFAEIARARRTLDAAGVSLDCHTDGVRLEPAQESVLSLVLREAVTNILRHAGATSCRLEVAADDRGTVLRVEDNGRGAIQREGNGIRGMRERVEALGGRLEIESRQGTRLTAEIPRAAVARA